MKERWSVNFAPWAFEGVTVAMPGYAVVPVPGPPVAPRLVLLKKKGL
jgi:hypothetical protein